VLDGLFPAGVATVCGDPDEPSPPLFPGEEALIERAVAKRRLEFQKARECARTAMARFGLGDQALLSGKDREPLWPAEVTGSITHTQGLCAVAVGSSRSYSALGIDAEPAEALASALVSRVCREGDDWSRAEAAGALESSVLPRLVFCVKEAVYKCQFPLSRKFLSFGDVTVELGADAFRAVLRVEAHPFRAGASFEGRWLRTERHLVAGTWLPR
jgi:4'-phosphopantetheinyl transferase EntD